MRIEVPVSAGEVEVLRHRGELPDPVTVFVFADGDMPGVLVAVPNRMRGTTLDRAHSAAFSVISKNCLAAVEVGVRAQPL